MRSRPPPRPDPWTAHPPLPTVFPPAPTPRISRVVAGTVWAGEIHRGRRHVYHETAAVVWYFSQSAARPGAATTPLPVPPGTMPRMIAIPVRLYDGEPRGEKPESNPAHPVSIWAFGCWIRKMVSNSQYAEFVKAPGSAPDTGTNNAYPAHQADWPATGVSWDDANMPPRKAS